MLWGHVGYGWDLGWYWGVQDLRGCEFLRVTWEVLGATSN